jgi:hypothetical protein
MGLKKAPRGALSSRQNLFFVIIVKSRRAEKGVCNDSL